MKIVIEKFIEENLTNTEGFIKIPAKEVYLRYLEFCYHYQMRPFGKKAFYSRLEDLGIVRENTKSRKNFKGWFLKRCPY